MSESPNAWKLWRHRENHAVRLWVETDVMGDPYHHRERTWRHVGVQRGMFSVGAVRTKTPRNLAFDSEDRPAHLAQRGPDFPLSALLKLYEPEVA